MAICKRLSILSLLFMSYLSYLPLQAQMQKADVMARRNYLVDNVIRADFGLQAMPAYLDSNFQGEWATVTFSMTACALANLCFAYPETRENAIIELEKLIPLMMEKRFRQVEKNRWQQDPLAALDSDNGHIGYLGHLNMVLAAYRIIGGKKYQKLHHNITKALVRRLSRRAFPYLETYPHEIYTADNVVVIASIALHGLIYKIDYSKLVSRWLLYTRKHLLDPTTKTMVFLVTESGRATGPSRGSGIGWNSFYLPFISKDFASHQYRNIHNFFIIKMPFGLVALREYPPGVEGEGDIDSGPVMFGISMSGSGFIIAGARHANDQQTVNGLLKTAEWAGGSYQKNGQKRYRRAPLVGNAIMLAMMTASKWDRKFLQQ